MFYFMNAVRSFMNYAIFRELCNQMRFEVDYAKSHHRVIPEGLLNINQISILLQLWPKFCINKIMLRDTIN